MYHLQRAHQTEAIIIEEEYSQKLLFCIFIKFFNELFLINCISFHSCSITSQIILGNGGAVHHFGLCCTKQIFIALILLIALTFGKAHESSYGENTFSCTCTSTVLIAH